MKQERNFMERRPLRAIRILIEFMLANIILDLAFGIGLRFILKNSSNPTLFSLVISQVLKLILVMIFIKLRRKKYFKTYGKDYIKVKAFDNESYNFIIVGLGIAGFGNILLGIFLKIFENNSHIQSTLELLEGVLTYNTKLEYISLFISVVILAPIVEELLFRGILFTETKNYLSLKAAVVLNGLAFAIYHMNIIQGLNTFFMGMVLAYVYYKRKNIKEVIGIHMVNNLLAMTMEANYYLGLSLGLISFISIFLTIRYLYRL